MFIRISLINLNIGAIFRRTCLAEKERSSMRMGLGLQAYLMDLAREKECWKSKESRSR